MTESGTDGAAERAGQRLVELARLVGNDDKYREVPWTGVTVIVTMRWGPNFEGAKRFTGYQYTAGPVKPGSGSTQRWQAQTPTRDSAGPAFVALAKAVAERDGREPFKHCLFQLDRESGAVNIEFCYDDTHPWNPSFGDQPGFGGLDEWVERLRPPSRP